MYLRVGDPSYYNYIIHRLSALDMALLQNHESCANYLISQGACTTGGQFHRAASTIQLWWKFCVHKVCSNYYYWFSLQTMLHLYIILYCKYIYRIVQYTTDNHQLEYTIHTSSSHREG